MCRVKKKLQKRGKLQGFVNYAFKNKKTGKDVFSFPADVSDTQQYKLFGNSVTIPVIKEMADLVHDILLKQDAAN